MLNKVKAWIQNYFKTKKTLTIITDVLFVVFIVLLLIPGTRKDVAALFIRLTSLPPSELSQTQQYPISQDAKQWIVTDMNGQNHTLGDWLDKPVFVNFWATWCPPCVAEMPGISDLYEQYKGRVHFVLLSDESPSKINAFAQEHQYQNLPFYRYQFVPHDFSTRSIPTTFILSTEGKVVLSKKGAARWHSGKVEKLLDDLLAGQN